MAEQISLTNNVDLVWMELAANCRIRGKSREEAREILNSKIGETITSKDNIRKKRDILLNMWYRDDEWFINRSIQAAEGMPTNSRIALHWAQLLRYYPVFYDLARLMGKLFEFQETITTGQIRQKIFDEWGERSTLDYSTGKIIAAMKALEAVSSPGTGKYIASSIPVKNEEVVSFLIKTAMHFSGSSYYSFSALNDFPFLFPFDYKVTKEQLMNDKTIVLSVFDSTLSVGLKN